MKMGCLGGARRGKHGGPGARANAACLQTTVFPQKKQKGTLQDTLISKRLLPKTANCAC